MQFSGAGRSTTNHAIHLVPVVRLDGGAIYDEFMRRAMLLYILMCVATYGRYQDWVAAILFPGVVVAIMTTDMAKPGA